MTARQAGSNDRWFVFNPDVPDERWEAPNPDTAFESSMASSYRYLVAMCPTTKDAIEKLREIRRAYRSQAKPSDGGT